VKSVLKNYVLLLTVATLAFLPMQSVSAKTDQQKSTQSTAKKKYIKKANYKRSNSRKEKLQARRIALAKQQATDLGEYYDGSIKPNFSSNSLLVVNQNTGEIKFSKNAEVQVPIASITKLMTAMVVLDADMPMSEIVTITDDDVDRIKGTSSRLPLGTTFSRDDMLKLALMSSENRAAYALSRHYPGGRAAFIRAMNAKALSLGLMQTHFSEPTGLSPDNKSTAYDLYQLVAAAYQYPFIRQATTTTEYEVTIVGRQRPLMYKNTNVLVRKGDWNIGLSKTGFINEAGRCLVMQATVANEPLMIVLLDAAGTNKRTGDANMIRKWLEYHHNDAPVQVAEQLPEQQQVNEQVLADTETEGIGIQPKLMMSQSIYDERYEQWLSEMEQH
jgi:D-alanyl-D-alanine endopeptidase (penicillin-binding protein 7)